MQTRGTGVVATFARAWVLLTKNPIIVIPALLIALLTAAASLVLSGDGFSSWAFFGNLDAQGSGAFLLFLDTIIAMGLHIVSALIAIAFTTGMAAAAWLHGRAAFADGVRALKQSGLRAFGALLILALLGILAAALIIPTFAVSVLAYLVFTIYTMPSAIIGRRGATESVIESMTIAWRSFAVTSAVIALILVLALIGGLLGTLLSGVPYLGQALQWTVMEIVVAYATLVVVGEYLALAKSPAERPF